jgi:hypothetical protein
MGVDVAERFHQQGTSRGQGRKNINRRSTRSGRAGEAAGQQQGGAGPSGATHPNRSSSRTVQHGSADGGTSSAAAAEVVGVASGRGNQQQQTGAAPTGMLATQQRPGILAPAAGCRELALPDLPLPTLTDVERAGEQADSGSCRRSSSGTGSPEAGLQPPLAAGVSGAARGGGSSNSSLAAVEPSEAAAAGMALTGDSTHLVLAVPDLPCGLSGGAAGGVTPAAGAGGAAVGLQWDREMLGASAFAGHPAGPTFLPDGSPLAGLAVAGVSNLMDWLLRDMGLMEPGVGSVCASADPGMRDAAVGAGGRPAPPGVSAGGPSVQVAASQVAASAAIAVQAAPGSRGGQAQAVGILASGTGGAEQQQDAGAPVMAAAPSPLRRPPWLWDVLHLAGAPVTRPGQGGGQVPLSVDPSMPGVPPATWPSQAPRGTAHGTAAGAVSRRYRKSSSSSSLRFSGDAQSRQSSAPPPAAADGGVASAYVLAWGAPHLLKVLQAEEEEVRQAGRVLEGCWCKGLQVEEGLTRQQGHSCG